MSYKQALTFGWAIAWRMLRWSAAVIAPPMLVAVFVIHRFVPIAGRDQALHVEGISLFLVLGLFVVLPQSIRGAVLSDYSDFRISVVGPVERKEGLTYFEALQVSLPAFVIYVGLGSLYYLLHLGGLLALAQIPFLVLVVHPAIAAVAVCVPFHEFPTMPDLWTVLRATARSPKWWVAFVGLILLATSYAYHREALLVGSPYESWSEISIFQNAAVIADSVEWWVYTCTYGTLDSAKMVLARWYYQATDPVGRTHHFKTYSNNVPASWIQPQFDFRTRDWRDFSLIDYDLFRGIGDRRPILIAREINLAFIYLLAACTLVSATALCGVRAVPLYLALAFLFSSADFHYETNFALPNAVCAVLSFLIIVLCQVAICSNRPRLLFWAAGALAIGANHKADFLVLALPVGTAAVLLGVWPAGSVKGFFRLAGKVALCFGVALLATNPFLVVAPRLELQTHASVLLFLHGNVNVGKNLGKLWHFLGTSFALPPGAEVITSHAVIAVCAGALLALSLLPLLFGPRLAWPQRLGSLILIASIAALLAMPVLNAGVLYERYFLNGWGALLAGAGCGVAAILPRDSRSGRITIVILCVALIPYLWVVEARFHQIRKMELQSLEDLDPIHHLDRRASRNALTLEALRASESGRFSPTVLIDQHAYLDLRAFVLSGLTPVYINADNFQQVVRDLPAGQYLTLFTRGDCQIEVQWLGQWPKDIQARYVAYLEFLSRKPVIWQRAGPLTKLLDVAPPQRGDNMSLAVISVAH